MERTLSSVRVAINCAKLLKQRLSSRCGRCDSMTTPKTTVMEFTHTNILNGRPHQIVWEFLIPSLARAPKVFDIKGSTARAAHHHEIASTQRFNVASLRLIIFSDWLCLEVKALQSGLRADTKLTELRYFCALNQASEGYKIKQESSWISSFRI